MEKGLILNTSYNDFILGTNVSDYFYKRHEEGVADDSPYCDTVAFDFYDDEPEIEELDGDSPALSDLDAPTDENLEKFIDDLDQNR